MPVTTALIRRLNVTNFAGSTAYIDRAQRVAVPSTRSMTGRGEGIMELAVCELLRLDDDLRADLFELFEVVANDPLILNIEKSRLGPVAIWCEGDFADHRIEGVGVDVAADVIWVQALRCCHRLFENLHAGIGVRRQVEAQEIGADFFGPLLIRREKFLDTRKIRRRRWHVE